MPVHLTGLARRKHVHVTVVVHVDGGNFTDRGDIAGLFDQVPTHGVACVMGAVVLDAGQPGGEISSPAITAYLLKLWSMPDPLIEAVLSHREPVFSTFAARSEDVNAADCVRAAWYACDNYLIGEYSDRPATETG